MAPREKKVATRKEEFDFLHLKVVDHSISVDASINPEILDTRRRNDDTTVYCFYSGISIDCKLIWPVERPDWLYHIQVYGHESSFRDFAMTLEDCHAKDEDGMPKYLKRVGQRQAVYNLPYGLGFWEKVRGQDCMSGAIWVSPQCLSDMIILLVNVKPLWVHIHELKVDRWRWIHGFRLQTDTPE